MSFAIDTDQSAPDPAKSYTFPTAMRWEPDQRPKLFFRCPLGRAIQDYQIKEAELDDRRASYLDDVELPAETEARAMAAQATGGEVLFAEDLDAEDGPGLEEVDDETRILTVEGVQTRMALTDWHPPDALRDWMMQFCVEHTVGCEHLPVRDADGDIELVEWRNKDQLELLFGTPAAEARGRLIESFGAEPWERRQAPYAYAETIATESGLDPDQKKD